MKGPGGIVTLELASNLDGAYRFLKNLKLFALAESLGGSSRSPSTPPR